MTKMFSVYAGKRIQYTGDAVA